MSVDGKPPEQQWYRKFAATLFNWTWTLLEKNDLRNIPGYSD